ncbi:MAG: ParM/StbA family protein [Chloroflexota bacterium]
MTKQQTKSKHETTYVGLDLGMRALKYFDDFGGLEMPSFVAVGGGATVGKMHGFKSQNAMQMTVGNQRYYVGKNAHDQGRPIENLDYDRLTNSPEIIALLYGALTERINQHGDFDAPITCIVGMPIETLSGDDAKANVAAVRKWMRGKHTWDADGKTHQIEIADVKVTSQPAGALMDFLLDDDGVFIAERKGFMKKEVGVVSVGFNTLELMAVRDKTPVQRLTAGSTVGVRRLLELLNHDGHYSLGELDASLRSGSLDLTEAMPIWQREVTGSIERKWGQQWRRFERIIVVGGGAVLLGNTFINRFNGKAYVPDQPVLSIARGLYKQAQAGRKRGA